MHRILLYYGYVQVLSLLMLHHLHFMIQLPIIYIIQILKNIHPSKHKEELNRNLINHKCYIHESIIIF